MGTLTPAPRYSASPAEHQEFAGCTTPEDCLDTLCGMTRAERERRIIGCLQQASVRACHAGAGTTLPDVVVLQSLASMLPEEVYAFGIAHETLFPFIHAADPRRIVACCESIASLEPGFSADMGVADDGIDPRELMLVGARVALGHLVLRGLCAQPQSVAVDETRRTRLRRKYRRLLGGEAAAPAYLQQQ